MAEPKTRVAAGVTKTSSDKMPKTRPTPLSLKVTTKAAHDAKRGYTDADRAEAMDNPPLTDAELASARPFAELFPDLAASIRRGRGPQKAPTKEPVKLRIDRDVLARFKADGPGWQTRMGEALRKAAKL